MYTPWNSVQGAPLHSRNDPGMWLVFSDSTRRAAQAHIGQTSQRVAHFYGTLKLEILTKTWHCFSAIMSIFSPLGGDRATFSNKRKLRPQAIAWWKKIPIWSTPFPQNFLVFPNFLVLVSISSRTLQTSENKYMGFLSMLSSFFKIKIPSIFPNSCREVWSKNKTFLTLIEFNQVDFWGF